MARRIAPAMKLAGGCSAASTSTAPVPGFPLLPCFNQRELLFISTFITVLVNIYIGLPLMHLFFGPWLRVPRGAQSDMAPWVVMLDVGLKRWQRILLIVVYYGFSLGFGWSYYVATGNK